MPVVWKMSIVGAVIGTFLVSSVIIVVYRITQNGKAQYGWYAKEDDVDDQRGEYGFNSLGKAVDDAKESLENE